MRVVVVGVGGIGGILAARLARDGVGVAPVTGNAEIAAAIAEHGFRVTEPGGESWSVPSPSAPKVALAAGDGPYDLCIAATKTTTLAAALRGAAAHLRDEA